MTTKEVKVKVFSSVYCSSSFDYVIELVVNYGGETNVVELTNEFSPFQIKTRDRRVKRETRYTWREARYARYVWQAIADELLKAINEDNWKFYEYDRDGMERYEDLRYHDKERFDSFVKHRYERLCLKHDLVPLLPS